MDSTIDSRIKKMIRPWPSSLKEEFERYIGWTRGGSQSRNSRQTQKEPYWMLLPSWLIAKYNNRKTKKHLRSQLLSDVHWAQYCLFLFIRIQDDLFDRHTKNLSLQFAADQFVFEAYAVLIPHFPRSVAFWNTMEDSLKQSTQAIVAVAELQASEQSSTERLLTGHKQVSSVFKIGSAAICCKAARKKDFKSISKFCDSMAVVGQILDDFQDIIEDLDSGKYNYVALRLFQIEVDPSNKVEIRDTKQILDKMAKKLVFSNVISEIIKEIRSHLAVAENASSDLGIDNLSRYVETYRASLDFFEKEFCRTRAEFVFGKMLNNPSKEQP